MSGLPEVLWAIRRPNGALITGGIGNRIAASETPLAAWRTAAGLNLELSDKHQWPPGMAKPRTEERFIASAERAGFRCVRVTVEE